MIATSKYNPGLPPPPPPDAFYMSRETFRKILSHLQDWPAGSPQPTMLYGIPICVFATNREAKEHALMDSVEHNKTIDVVQ
jgi:hypothetical protein